MGSKCYEITCECGALFEARCANAKFCESCKKRKAREVSRREKEKLVGASIHFPDSCGSGYDPRCRITSSRLLNDINKQKIRQTYDRCQPKITPYAKGKSFSRCKLFRPTFLTVLKNLGISRSQAEAILGTEFFKETL